MNRAVGGRCHLAIEVDLGDLREAERPQPRYRHYPELATGAGLAVHLHLGDDVAAGLGQPTRRAKCREVAGRERLLARPEREQLVELGRADLEAALELAAGRDPQGLVRLVG